MGFPRPNSAGGGDIDLSAINSDLSEPLNYLAWIQDLATYGEDSYVYTDEAKLTELSAKSNNAINHKIAVTYLLEGIIQNGFDVGAYFEAVTGDTTNAFDGLTTISQVIDDSNAMTIVAASETAMTIVAASETAMPIIAASGTAMTIIDASETAILAVTSTGIAMSVIIRSSIAMNKIVINGFALNSIAKSKAAKTAIITNQTIFNTYTATILSTLNASSTYFNKTTDNGNMSGTSTKTIGTNNSIVYVKVLNDITGVAEHNWTSAAHAHNNVEMIHAAFPTGASQGSVTVNLFALGGFLGKVGAANTGLTYTTDKYEAI